MAAAANSSLWADKYAPRTVSEMCCPAMAARLKQWIEMFPTQSKNPNFKRAVLLSGPPGVGKTTTAHLVARECGYQVVEFNASDHRSAASLKDSVSHVVDNHSMSGLGFGNAKARNDDTLKLDRFVILMDEVDGCDRGGVAQVIDMIKKTKVPIICTCNDRWHQKLRSLVNYVEDLKFSRPPFNIVASYIKERVLDREQCSVPHGLLQDVIKLEGNDIRSVLNNLQMWCRSHRHMTERQLVDAAKRSYKNEDVGLFGAAETFLLQGSSANANAPRKSFEELQALFYSEDLIDLFVQENYLHFKPERGDWMAAVARAAASVSRADVVRRAAFVDQNWSVSNYHVLASAIAPCAFTRGHYQSFVTGPAAGFDRSRPVKFPSWLGNNSTALKFQRLATALAKQGQHPLHGMSASAEEVVMDYCPTLAAALTQPMAGDGGKSGVPKVIEVMDAYHMIRDDWDFVQDVTRFRKSMASTSHQARLTSEVPSVVKTAFTRAFNSTHKMESVVRARLGAGAGVVEDDGGAGGDEDDGGAEDGEEGGEEPKARKHRPEAPVKAKAPAAKRTTPKAPAAKPAGKRGGKQPLAAATSQSQTVMMVDDD